MEITGILKVVYDTIQVSEKFRKREIVVTTEPTSQYPQHILIQLTQDKCDLVNDLQRFPIGGEVKVSINLRGREWNGPQGVKYFNTIEAWRIEAIGVQTSQQTPQPPTDSPANDDNEDLPL
jgi:hypothetical protein